MSRAISPSAEDAPLLTDSSAPNDPDSIPPANRGPPRRTRTAPVPGRDKKSPQLVLLLTMLSLFLLVLTCIFAGLYARGVTNKRPAPITNPSPLPIPDKPPKDKDNSTTDAPCLTPDCVLTAAKILSDIDTSVDPCDDFFKYSCGGWIKKNVIPDDKGRYGYFDSLYQDNQKILKDILEGDYEEPDGVSAPSLPPPASVIDKQNFYKLQSLYRSCMNESVISELGVDPLNPVLAEIINRFPVGPEDSLLYHLSGKDGKNLKNVDKQNGEYKTKLNSTQLTDTLSYLAGIGVSPLLSFVVETDSKNPEANVVALYQNGLGLPSKEYYEEKEILDVYKQIVAELLDKTLRSQDDFAANEDASNPVDVVGEAIEKGLEEYWSSLWTDSAGKIVDFEVALAKISLPPEVFNDPEAIYNPQTFSQLNQLSTAIQWVDFIKTLAPQSTKLPSNVIVTSIEYIKNLDELIRTTPTEVLQVYFIWQTISSYGEYLDENFREPLRRLQAALRGIDSSVKPKRWEVCLREVDKSMGQLAGRYFVLKAFSGDSKPMADSIITAIKDSFNNRLPELDWLDDETRKLAVEKVEYIYQKVGFPTTTPDARSPQSLAEYYAKIVIDEQKYFANILSAAKWKVYNDWKDLGKPVDRGVWFMTPQTVNAYYNPTANEIVFPAGILQQPFFHVKDPEYVNFGGIGMVVGHELTHGFDNAGRMFDKYGKLTQWWSNATIEAFENKAKCFVEQYSNYTIIGPNGEPTHLNGNLTLGENLADNGGIRAAYSAWRARLDDDPDQTKYQNQVLPGLQDFSREQLFYVSFARSWCSKMRPETAVERVRTDPHSPAEWRVNGVLQNTPHFSEVYNCKKNSRMNPENKCYLW